MNSNWSIVAEPTEGWIKHSQPIFLYQSIALLVSLSSGVLLFSLLYTKGKLKYQAFNDSLTDLYNRHALNALYANFPNAKKTNLETMDAIMLDLDRFKVINDDYGHDVGRFDAEKISKK